MCSWFNRVTQFVVQKLLWKNRKETVMYQKPTITKIGNYRTLTNGAGKARERDLLGFSALIVIHWPWG